MTAGLILFSASAIYLVVAVIGVALAPGFSLSSGTISDLGVTPVTGTLFNTMVIGVGVLNVAGGIALWRAGWGMAAILFGAGGLGAAGVGVFTLDTVESIHRLFAFVAFLSFNILPLVAIARIGGPMRWLGLAAGIGGLVFLGLTILGEYVDPWFFGAIGRGGTERLIVYPPLLWTLAFAGYLMAGRTQRSRIDPQVRGCPVG